MIRPATPEDYQPISEMLADFHAAAGQAYTEFDPASTLNWVTFLATSPLGAVLVADEGGRLAGVIAGIVVPVFVNHAQNMAQESFMWVRPEARRAGTASALIRALEAWASVRGARTLTMVSWHGSDHEKVNGLYAHLGYKPLEYHWVRVLAGTAPC